MSVGLEKFKSVIHNYITNRSLSNPTVRYSKIYLYNEVQKKLYHNLTVMPKDDIDGIVFIWKFAKNKVYKLSMPMDEPFQRWKELYNKFVDRFSADAYIYYIETDNEKIDKFYRTIIVLFPKEKQFEYVKNLISNENVEIEDFVKNEFNSKLDEQLKIAESSKAKQTTK